MPMPEINCCRLGYSWLGLVLRAKMRARGRVFKLARAGWGKIWRVCIYGDQPAYS